MDNDDIKLPDDINELEYVLTYNVKQYYKLSYFFVYNKLLVEFNWLSNKEEYLITLYKCESSSNDIYHMKELKYEEYKYTTEEIKDYLSNFDKEISDYETAKKIITTKYLHSIRREKIKKIIYNNV